MASYHGVDRLSRGCGTEFGAFLGIGAPTMPGVAGCRHRPRQRRRGARRRRGGTRRRGVPASPPTGPLARAGGRCRRRCHHEDDDARHCAGRRRDTRARLEDLPRSMKEYHRHCSTRRHRRQRSGNNATSGGAVVGVISMTSGAGIITSTTYSVMVGAAAGATSTPSRSAIRSAMRIIRSSDA